jgi:predicted HAD superfamily Cof-like phosphohydrolase
MDYNMTKDWVKDIHEMHAHYGVHPVMKTMDAEKLWNFLKFRANFLQEELDELRSADNAEDVVDALIDLCVVAIGTLDAFGVDSHKAWDAVLEANMNKQVGVKASRPNPLGLPDLIKPEGWTAPSHEGNHGMLKDIF